MSALKTFIDQKNSWNAIFKGEQFHLATAEARQRVANIIDSDLSPENLTCDGELPRSKVKARFAALTAAAKELIKLDPSVKMFEF